MEEEIRDESGNVIGIMISAAGGLGTAQLVAGLYASQPSPQPQHIFGRRVHHIDIGVGGVVVSGIIGAIGYMLEKDDKKKQLIAEATAYSVGFFGGLAWDDRADIGELFKFRKKSDC